MIVGSWCGGGDGGSSRRIIGEGVLGEEICSSSTMSDRGVGVRDA
jgi:hypothetical protein